MIDSRSLASVWPSWSRRVATALLIGLVALPALRATPPSAGATAPGAPDFAAIDRYVEAELRATRLPGLALAIVQRDQVVHLRGFGRADRSGRAVTAQTPFTIGSTTKSFTALAVMQLVEAGKVELDAPVQRYLPWFRLADPEGSAQLTVRHLLSHTSGFSREAGLAFIGRRDDGPGALEERVRAASTVRLIAPPGEAFQYSNLNYSILGLIVQTVSGRSYERYVTEQILAPLEMGRTSLFREEARQHGLAAGHRYWFGRPIAYEESYHRGEVPAGFIHASAEDMARYLIAHLSGGRSGGARVLSPQGMAELHRPAARAPLGGPDVYYAMGWVVGEINGVRAVYHGGDTAAYHSDMILVPQEGWGIALLMNGNNSMEPARIQGIAKGVMSLLLGRQPEATSGASSVATFFRYLLVGVGVQALGMARTVALLRRWRADPARRPRGPLKIGLQILPALAINILWGLLWLVGVPAFLHGPLSNQLLFVPDFGYTLLLSAGIALAWGLLRPVLVLRALRGGRTPAPAGVPATT